MNLIVKISEIISTFFYIGYISNMPATVSTFLSTPFVIYINSLNNIELKIGILLFLIALAAISSSIVEKQIEKKDPKEIVIDEIIGFTISLFLIKLTFLNILLAFLIFRLLDVVKPAPAYQIQKLKGGIGIIGDDIVIGLYTNILLRIINLL